MYTRSDSYARNPVWFALPFLAGCATVQPSKCEQTLVDPQAIREKVVAIIAESDIPRPDWSKLDREFLEASEKGPAIFYTAYFKAPPLGSIDIRFDCLLEPNRVRYNKYGEFTDYYP